MTPAEWHASTDALALFAAAPPGARRARLFQVACLRRHFDAGDDVFRDAVDVAERFADGLADAAELDGFLQSLLTAFPDYNTNRVAFRLREAACWACFRDRHTPSLELSRVRGALSDLADVVAYQVAASLPDYQLAVSFRLDIEERKHAQLFRCLVPPPFSLAVGRPEWRTSAVIGIAASIYDGRHFHDCPMLADAFEDAGCDDADLLGHLRSPGPHARGCWPVDLALGRDLSA